MQEDSRMKFVIGMALTSLASLCVASAALAQEAPAQQQQVTEQKQVTRTDATTGTAPGTDVPVTQTTSSTSYSSETYVQPVETEQRTYWRHSLTAPRDAIELGVSTGYTQGFGNIGRNRTAHDLAGPGLGIGANLGYRLSPYWSLGLHGMYQELSPTSTLANARARGALAGLDATYHLSPFDRVDVWGSLGAGYRFLWDLNGSEDSQVDGSGTTVREASNGNIMRHGFELARLELGFDVRVSKSVGIGPLVGADISTMLWRDEGRGAGSEMMSDRGLTTFVYGGLQGRFDIGGDRVDRMTNRMAARRY